MVAALQRASTDGQGGEWGLTVANPSYVDPVAFIMRAFAAVITTQEAIMAAVPWVGLVGGC